MPPPLPRWLAVLFAAGLGLVLSAAAAEPPVKIVVQLPYLHQFQFAGLYAAQTKGFFRDHGLQVELRSTSSEQRSSIAAVLEGRAQFGISQGPQLVARRMKGADLVVVAAIMQHSPQILVSRLEDNIRTPHDLIGKRVALDQTSLVSEIRVMLEREGVSLDRITVIPNKWEVNELEAKTAEAMTTFVIDGPYELEKAGIPVNIIRPVDYGVDYYGDCLFATARTVRENPELVEAMRLAVIQGWDYALRHPEEMIDLILAKYGAARPSLTRESMRYEAKQVARLINADLVGLGHINEGRWRVMGEILHAQDASTDLARLDGFVYRGPQDSELDRFRPFFRWLWWGLAVVAVVVALTFLAMWRLRRLVERRTRELQDAEHKQREIFELAPAPITRNSYEAILPQLAGLRAGGVANLEAHLQEHPGLLRDWCALVQVIDANRLALRIAGVGSVAELDRQRLEMMTPESISAFRQELLAIWENQDQLRLEKSYRSADGRRHDSLINWSAPPRDGRPDYTHVQLVHTDVTEIREAELALRESEQRYRLLFEQSPLAIVEFDYSAVRPWFEELRARGVTDLAAYLAAQPEARAEAIRRSPLVEVNQVTLEFFGAISKAELVARLPSILTEKTILARCENVVRVWQGIPTAHGELEVRHPDGQLRTLAFHWRMQSAGGNSIDRSQSVLVDITEKLAAERAMRESEARYRELFENAVGGIYRSTAEGRFTAANPALARMLGFDSAPELIDYYRAEVVPPFYVQPGRGAEFRASLRQDELVANFESEVYCKNGAAIWISENARVVHDRQGNDIYYEGFVTDITMHRRLDQEMQRASKLEAVGILAGGIAHDFNNILTVVLGNIALAEMDSGADGPGSRMLGEAKRAALRARDLTQQLLTFSKGGEPLRTAVNLPELLRESTDFALHGAKARADFEIAADLWPVNADKGQLGQVVQNLAINSVQAMPDGGILKVGAENVTLGDPAGSLPLAPGRYVHLFVTDSGIGIADEHLAKIFDPYFTTKQQGSGLGLATVYSIVKKHQGHIEVESQQGRGTTFHLWLPATTQPVIEKIVVTPTDTPLQARVLFMDDEQSIRGMARLFLSRLHLESEMAVDGAEALRKYQEALTAGRPFDVVVMDLTVPGAMGGREAMAQLLKIDPAVRAIVSSGYSQDPVMASFRVHGFKGILPKPYDLVQLRQAIEHTLGNWPGGPEKKNL